MRGVPKGALTVTPSDRALEALAIGPQDGLNSREASRRVQAQAYDLRIPETQSPQLYKLSKDHKTWMGGGLPHLQTDTRGHFAVKSFYLCLSPGLSSGVQSPVSHTWHPWVLYSRRKSWSCVQAARWRVLRHRRSEGISSIQLLESSKY